MQAAVEELQVEWQAKHAAEVAEIETCRAQVHLPYFPIFSNNSYSNVYLDCLLSALQLAKGFPEQTERAASEIHAKVLVIVPFTYELEL